MTKLIKNSLLLFITISLFTGCKNLSSSTENSSQSSTSTSSSQKDPLDVSKELGKTSSNSNFLAPTIILPENIGTPIRSSTVIQSGNTLYYCNWSDENKIYKINVDGTGKQKIGDDSVEELILSDTTLYYTNKSDLYKIYSINTDGTKRKKIFNEKSYNLILLDKYLYYIDSINNLSILNLEEGVKNSLNVVTRTFDSDGINIYYEDYLMKNSLRSVRIDGTNKTKITADTPMNILVDSEIIYYSNGGENNKLYKVSNNGEGRVKLNDFKSTNLVLDSGYIFYINGSDFNKIYKINIDGTNNIKVSDESFVKHFAIAGNFIYYSKETDVSTEQLIYKMDKNGS